MSNHNGHIFYFANFNFSCPSLHSGKIQLKWVTESTDETPEDVIPGTGHWSTFGLDGRTQPDNWLYRTSPPPADEAKVHMSMPRVTSILLLGKRYM